MEQCIKNKFERFSEMINVLFICLEIAQKPLEGKEFEGKNGKFKYMWLFINKLIDDLHLRNHTR